MPVSVNTHLQRRIEERKRAFHVRRLILYCIAIVLGCAAVHKILDVPVPVILVFAVIIGGNVFMFAHMLSSKSLQL